MSNPLKIVVIVGLVYTLSGCQTTTGTEGAGFVLTTPKADTVRYITSNDRPFAEQVAGNNRACRRSEACVK